uniref:EGF-like domain-containing protein n=2 Tax=Zea mays TaxID=4577 RepID=A0A804NRC5_MAIZE
MRSKCAMAISSSTSRTQDLVPLLCLLLMAAAAPQHSCASPPLPVTLPGCPDKCGNISIPYPFGTKEGCFKPDFEVLCNDSFHPPRAFIQMAGAKITVDDTYYKTNEDGMPDNDIGSSEWPIELVDVSVSEGKARVLGAFSYDCKMNDTYHAVRRQEIDLGYWMPFSMSDADDVLMGIGSNVVAKQTSGPQCQSYLLYQLSTRKTDDPVNGSCSGQGCCSANLRSGGMAATEVTIQKNTKDDGGFYGDGVSCSYAMIVDKSWYNFSSPDVDSDAFLRRNAAGVPVVVNFSFGVDGCPNASEPTPDDFACVSNYSTCIERPPVLDNVSIPYFCSCSAGYEGNPYIHGGCQDIDECARPHMYPCYGGKCKNTPGDYECSCPAGTKGNAKQAPCTDLFPLPAKISVVLGLCSWSS